MSSLYVSVLIESLEIFFIVKYLAWARQNRGLFLPYTAFISENESTWGIEQIRAIFTRAKWHTAQRHKEYTNSIQT